MAALNSILVCNGVEKWACDNQMRTGYTVHLTNVTIVKVYLFGNLVTAAGAGADVVLTTDAPNPYSQINTIGDLHMFRATGNGSLVQGESERTFPSGDGIYIPNNNVQLMVIGQGGGTIEVYAEIWVK